MTKPSFRALLAGAACVVSAALPSPSTAQNVSWTAGTFTLAGEFRAESIEIGAAATLVLTGDAALVASGDIRVDGRIVRTNAGAAPASLRVVAGGDLTVTGSIDLASVSEVDSAAKRIVGTALQQAPSPGSVELVTTGPASDVHLVGRVASAIGIAGAQPSLADAALERTVVDGRCRILVPGVPGTRGGDIRVLAFGAGSQVILAGGSLVPGHGGPGAGVVLTEPVPTDCDWTFGGAVTGQAGELTVAGSSPVVLVEGSMLPERIDQDSVIILDEITSRLSDYLANVGACPTTVDRLTTVTRNAALTGFHSEAFGEFVRQSLVTSPDFLSLAVNLDEAIAEVQTLTAPVANVLDGGAR